MEYRYLGKSGLIVSEFTLGTMTFGASGWGCAAEESHKIIAAYLEAGGNMIDVADVYAKGETERIIGAYMPNIKRDEVLIASKCNFPFGTSKNGLGSSRKHMIESVEGSLRRLKTDYLDIYYLHRSDPSVAAEEIMETFDILIRQGKVLYPACSNLPAWRIMADNLAAKARHSSQFVCGQYMYNLVDRNCEQEIIPAMIHEGIGFLCWSPLAGGLLTGKYRGTTAVPKDSRFEHRKSLDVPRFWTEHGVKVSQGLIALSERSGLSPIDLALGWLLSKKHVSSVIVGAKSVGQLQENLNTKWNDIPAEVLAELDALSEPNRSYLWSFNEEANSQFKARGQQFPGTIIC